MRMNSLSPLTLLILLAPGLAACGDEDAAARITFPVEVMGKQTKLPNDHGYTVAITRARLHIGPVYFYSGEPLFTRRAEDPWYLRIIRAAAPVGTAHAHPGHYQEGDALGELLTSRSFDLLGKTPVTFGTAAGVTGAYRSAQVNLSPASGGHTVEVAGTASKGSHQVTFSATLDLTEKVKGIAFGARVTAAPGRVRIAVDLACWLERVDVSRLSGTGTATFQAGSQAQNALRRGVVNTSAYILTWIPQSP